VPAESTGGPTDTGRPPGWPAAVPAGAAATPAAGAADTGSGTTADPASGHRTGGRVQFVSDGDAVGAFTGTAPVGTATTPVPDPGGAGAACVSWGHEKTPASTASVATIEPHHRDR
jgi:hypothetical protein